MLRHAPAELPAPLTAGRASSPSNTIHRTSPRVDCSEVDVTAISYSPYAPLVLDATAQLRSHHGMGITEAQLGWLMGCALLLGWPALATALALLHEQRVLGKLYWHWRALLDARKRR
jgi:hypothetical protein